MKALAFVFFAVSIAAGQADSRPHPYLFRISHKTFDESSCALLHGDGSFHLEFADGDDIRVFEGNTSAEDVVRVQRALDDPQLTELSQIQIEEPIVRGRTEQLQLTIYRQDHWQDLFFQSVESEAPFKGSLEELVR